MGEGYDENYFANAMQERESATYNLLNMNNTMDGLKSALSNPPLGCYDEAILKQNADLVLQVISQVKDADIDKHVSNVAEEDVDTLMKYIYKGFERCDNSASLLKWHAAVLKRGGEGTIVRAIADRWNI
mmetsp:Transcript_28703/g.80236  ORF Transcript_28703/g.80236 Transcript_28703/m.80236 type:complete len:129 (+) Transcript_28703:87-473(+)|eukprot:CAMPEP_0119125036 /NCGR_PEP_ID=MMETSP1310-20130426/4446_1 /TAXON_ID=464262 /ORGANISM="Genus nov. species nov., Strain RCC2339" /LENGTH=128 /DNA_ID=CAMNT_0007115055 /DNA_START=70 /DNA_END=456 /DNA_ORIENTATION=-